MILEAIYHRPKLNWAYAYDANTIHLRLRTKRTDVLSVSVWAGDKYAWDTTNKLITMYIAYTDALFDYWECEIKPPFHRLKYGFLLQSDSDTWWMTERSFQQERPDKPDRLFEFPYMNPADLYVVPMWVKEAVFYQIFPERFASGNPSLHVEGTLDWGGKPERDNFFGGDLEGVIQHLDHMSSLGITAIYFTPIFEATTNHKYDTQDYMKVDPQFGDLDTLKRLVELCHARDIKVLLDAVFNHSGKTFAPFIDVQKNGARSKYRDWFYVHEFPLAVKEGIPTYDTFGFEPLMPKLNTHNPEVRDYLLGVVRHWMREANIDGWRLDVANEVDQQFWREFRKTVKAINPDAYILGEVWHEASPWLQGDQFDAVMNYPFTDALIDFIIRGTLDAEGFAHATSRQLALYPRQASEVAFNILDSHDTPRLLSLCKGNQDLLKLAVLIQFTYIGTPCIFYGDEIGLSGEQDPDCRKCMEWDVTKQDLELFAFYQKMIKLRKSYATLREGSIHFLQANQGGKVLVFERKLQNQSVIVALNNDQNKATISIPVNHPSWSDLSTGHAYVTQDGALSIELPAYGFTMLANLSPV